MSQNKIILAKAGFYSGMGDIVICYFCGIRVYKWLTSDIPLSEHMKIKSSCTYIRLFQKRHCDKMIIYNNKDQILNLFTKIKFSLQTLNQFLKKLFSYCLNMLCYFSYKKFNMFLTLEPPGFLPT